MEDANIDELRRALGSAGYEATPDVLKIITDRENRLRSMYMLDLDAEEVARAIPGTHFEQPFEIAGEKYFFDARKGTWVQEREEGVMKTLFGDKKTTDPVITTALDQARAKAGLPKAQPAVIQTGENTFEIAGKEYYLEDGVWKQKRSFWFDKKLDETEDSGILTQLDETRSKMIEEGIAVEPDILASNKQVLGAVANDPRIENALQNLPISINCKATSVGRAISGCPAVVEVEKVAQLREVDRINDVLEETGRAPIEVVTMGDNVVDLEQYRQNTQFIKDTKNELDDLLSQIVTPTTIRKQIEPQINDITTLEELALETYGKTDPRYRKIRFERIALDSRYNDPLVNPFVEVTSEHKAIAESFQPNHKIGSVEGLVSIIESEALVGPASRGEKTSSLLAKRGQTDAIFLSAGGPYSHLYVGEIPDRHNSPLLVFDRNNIYDNPTFKATPRDSIGYSTLEEITEHNMNPGETNQFLEVLAANNQLKAEVPNFAVGSQVSKPVGTFAPEITLEGRIDLDAINKIILTENDKNQLLRQLRETSKFKNVKSNTEMKVLLKDRFGIEMVIPDQGLSVDQMYWKTIGQPIPVYG